MQLTMVSIKIGIVFSIFIVVTFGDLTDYALNSYLVFAERGGTVLLPCVQRLDKGNKNTDCIWTSVDSAGESDMIIAANSSIPNVDQRFKIEGDWQNGNCSLQLSSVKEEDKKTYFCKAFPSKQHVSKVQLLLGEKSEYPKIFYEGNDVTSEEHVEAPNGADIQLKCVVKKGNPLPNISWVGFDSDKATNTSQVGETSSVLNLTSDDIYYDERTIVCLAEQPLYPGVVATVNVSIGYPYPIREVNIWPLTIDVGEQFTCDADGIPRPVKYIWKRKEGQDWTEIPGENAITYKPRKDGTYKCLAKNILNNNFIESRREATVAVTTMKVRIFPEEITLGQLLECMVFDEISPANSFYWEKKKDYGIWETIMVGIDNKFTPDQEGIYKCYARNALDLEYVESENESIVKSAVDKEDDCKSKKKKVLFMLFFKEY